jgi:ATP-dependent DNA helicase DinG
LERMIQNRQGALLGVGSFWEGIDLPGSALQAVIIPRLPFSVPTTPVNAARIERVLSRGGDSFENLQLPTATLKLKQGFGRLIRSSTDRGAVVILDKRLAIKSYGLHMRNSLPPARLVLGPWKEVKTSLEQFYRLDE